MCLIARNPSRPEVLVRNGRLRQTDVLDGVLGCPGEGRPVEQRCF